ncbi:hypothetical protein PRZ48_000060 [Zasmidium cellare]|uniref:Uncharacterized protein n=1 Tax=Zasmidium cellare TaxID=395010 RepID=A0ABR0EY05_ZASCE|nr:hypothetical protein PRZ48_000060 [Zasmidium cellare]
MQCMKKFLKGGGNGLRGRVSAPHKEEAAEVSKNATPEVEDQESKTQVADPIESSIAQKNQDDIIKLPKDIHQELRKSIRLHRRLYDFEGDHAKTINTLSARWKWVKNEIKELQEGIAKLEAEDPEANENDIEIKKFDLAPRLREYEELLDERDEANDELDAKCKEFRSETFRLFALWHQILGDCEEDPEETVDPDVAQDNEEPSEEAEPAWPKPPSVQADRPRAPTPDSPSEVAPPNREKLLDDYKCCWRELDSAEWCLANRHLRFDDDMACCHRMYLAKQPGCEMKQEVEMRHLGEWREITQRVIVAEQELEKAEQALMEAGIRPPGSEYGLGMVKEVEDGYRVSDEVDEVEAGQDPRVQKWLKKVPASMEDADPLLSADEPAQEPAETDTWYAPEPEVWESLSMVAQGRQKKKINLWRAQAKAAAPRVEEAPFSAVAERASSKSWKSKVWNSLIELAKMYPAVPLVF